MMSGTSLDGVDLALCSFYLEASGWKYTLEAMACIPYPEHWQQRLREAANISGEALSQLNIDYGIYLGDLAKTFLEDKEQPSHIASHGHTIFHQPLRGMTLQIGSGQALAIASGIPVIADFRSKDVLLGGQGAPLVPIGDRELFGSYSYCLNIGGIANVSFQQNEQRIAYDICPANMVLNALVNPLGMDYDAGGVLARSGKIHQPLVQRLNALPYYHQPFPKSMGREWVEDTVFPLLKELSIEDLLATFCEHMAIQIGRNCTHISGKEILVTGGGALNTYLIERIQQHTDLQVVIPAQEVIAYKEALVFAFLGLKYLRVEVNCLASVTGARQDSIGGVLFQPN